MTDAEDSWSGYRVRVHRTSSWGPQAWKAEVSHKVSRPWPEGPLSDEEKLARARRRRRRGQRADDVPEPLDLVDVVLDVGYAFAWTRAGAHRKADRVVARDRRRSERWRNADERIVP